MDRPGKFEHNRFIGDKRSQVVLRHRRPRRVPCAADRGPDGAQRRSSASGPTRWPRPATGATTCSDRSGQPDSDEEAVA